MKYSITLYSPTYHYLHVCSSVPDFLMKHTSTHLWKGTVLQSIFSYYVTQKLLQHWVISCFQVACSTNYHYIKHLFLKREHENKNTGVTKTESFFEEILQTTVFFSLAEITIVSHLTALIFSRNFLDSMFPSGDDVSRKNLNGINQTPPLHYESYDHDN